MNAQECVCFLGLTRGMLSWLTEYSSCLEEALARKVNCRMIMPRVGKTNAFWKAIEIFKRYSDFTVKVMSEPPTTTFSVWDRKEIMITVSAIDAANPALSLWSNNKNIVTLCQEYFEFLWCKAEKTDFNVDQVDVSALPCPDTMC